jgi:hypothetical protein
MRYFLLFISINLLLGVANAQNINLLVNEVDLTNGALTVSGSPSDEYIKVVINVSNNSTNIFPAMMKKTVIQPVAGILNTFCIGGCYDPNVTVSTSPFNINPGATTGREDIYVEVYPEGNTGSVIILYEIFNNTNSDDKATIEITFNIGVTSTPTLTNKSILNISVNPYNFLSVNYSLSKPSSKSKIVITNILGVRQLEVPIYEQTGRIELSMGNLPRGTYICSLQSDGRNVVAKKFVVN